MKRNKGVNLTGRKFNRLTVVKRDGFLPSGKGTTIAWLCRCDCGKLLTIRGHCLTSGNTQSCGCLRGSIIRICEVEGCEEKHRAKGYCFRHYVQMRKYGKILNRTRNDPNEIIIKGDVAEIILYNNKSEEIARAIIDAEDVDRVKDYKWHQILPGYVVAKVGGKQIGIQHIILGVKPDRKKLIDHKNRNPLINCKLNLRGCTKSQNAMNAKKPKHNTSGFKGVKKSGKKWRAAIRINQKDIHLGTFRNRISAATAYNQAALKHHGEFACLNEI